MEWSSAKVCDYVARSGLLGEGGLSAVEVGDGNINIVFCVWSTQDRSRSLIFKHAPPYIKVLGPGYPLTQHRIAIEARAMMLFHELVPGSVPKPLHYDLDTHVLLMEDLLGYHILRDALVDGDIRHSVAASVGCFMGTVHRTTLADRLPDSELQELLQDFHNPDMQAITSAYVFTKPFQQDPTNRNTAGLDTLAEEVRCDQALLAEISRLRARFNNAQEGVVHGDLHTGSVMVREQDARVIDGEFAFFGPIAFDMGALLANYLLAWHAHSGENQDKLLHSIGDCWQAYGQAMDLPEGLQEIWREAIQFAGVKMLRRILGAAHVKDIECIEDGTRRVAVETQAIGCARELILSPPTVTELAQMLAQTATQTIDQSADQHA
jgi:5-methylthioribose kinase